MKDYLREIIKDGVRAPSGKNYQPWRFEVGDNLIRIVNLPERDDSLYQAGNRGSYSAHGALIENIVISATAHSFKSDVELWPNSKDENVIAEIKFSLVSEKMPERFSVADIWKRHTNRKEYKNEPLSEEKIKILEEAGKEAGIMPIKIKFLTDREKVKNLGKAVSFNERIIFEDQSLHQNFFEHVFWDKKDNTKPGFYIKTLELLPPQEKAMNIFKHWKILRIFNKIGASKMIANDNAGRYGKSGAFGLVYFDEDRKEDWVSAGRVFERIWLEAARQGLAFQPTVGVLLLHYGMKHANRKIFSPKHEKVLEESLEIINDAFALRGETPAILFRLGVAEDPTAYSDREDPQIKFI